MLNYQRVPENLTNKYLLSSQWSSHVKPFRFWHLRSMFTAFRCFSGECFAESGRGFPHHIRDQLCEFRAAGAGSFSLVYITLIRKLYVIIHASNTVILYIVVKLLYIYIYIRYVLWLYTCSLSEGSNITFAPSFTAVSTPDDVVISGRWWKKKPSRSLQFAHRTADCCGSGT